MRKGLDLPAAGKELPVARVGQVPEADDRRQAREAVLADRLQEPVVVAVVNVPPVKSPSEVFTTDAVLDAISKSSPPLTATISEEAEEYWLQAL